MLGFSLISITVADPPRLPRRHFGVGIPPIPSMGDLMTMLTAGAHERISGTLRLGYQWTVSTGAPGPVTFDFGGANPTTRACVHHYWEAMRFTATITDPLNSQIQTSTVVVVNGGASPHSSGTPTVQITSINPSNSNFICSFRWIFTLTATVSGMNNVSQVMFYANGFPVGSAAVPPYTANWQNMLPGNYYIIAMAKDGSGASIQSAPAPVTVNNPVVVITTVTPSGATTQDNSFGNPPFVFTVEGAGFERGNGVTPSSVVLWNGTCPSQPS